MEGDSRSTPDQKEMIVLQILFYFLASLFLAKIVWNVLTPIAMSYRLYRNGEDEVGGISLALAVEIGLYLILVFLAVIVGGEAWIPVWREVAFWGLGIIVLSYICFFAVSVLAGFIASKMGSKLEGSESQ